MVRKRVLVTGSSRGIGRAIALRLADASWNVSVHYTNGKKEALQVQDALRRHAAGSNPADLPHPQGAFSQGRPPFTLNKLLLRKAAGQFIFKDIQGINALLQ